MGESTSLLPEVVEVEIEDEEDEEVAGGTGEGKC
jgi:hypothetical protein